MRPAPTNLSQKERPNTEHSLSFSCDYMEGAHPQILQRLVETNLEKKHQDMALTAIAKQRKRRSAKPAMRRQQRSSFWSAARRQTPR